MADVPRHTMASSHARTVTGGLLAGAATAATATAIIRPPQGGLGFRTAALLASAGLGGALAGTVAGSLASLGLGAGTGASPAAAAVGGAVLAGGAGLALAALARSASAPHRAASSLTLFGAGFAGAAVVSALVARADTSMNVPSAPRPPRAPSEPRPNNTYVAGEHDLLPDLVPVSPWNVEIRWQDVRRGDLGQNSAPASNRRLLRFDGIVANIGQGPFEVAFDRARPLDPSQLITTTDGGYREVTSRSAFIYDAREDHVHTHMDDFGRYELFAADASGVPSELLRQNYKVSFRIVNTNQLFRDLDPHGQETSRSAIADARGRREVHGISVGWADRYGAALQGQAFDITGLPDGTYVLRHTIDPNDRFAESNESNNVRDTLITIRGDNVTSRSLGAPRTAHGDHDGTGTLSGDPTVETHVHPNMPRPDGLETHPR